MSKNSLVVLSTSAQDRSPQATLLFLGLILPRYSYSPNLGPLCPIETTSLGQLAYFLPFSLTVICLLVAYRWNVPPSSSGFLCSKSDAATPRIDSPKTAFSVSHLTTTVKHARTHTHFAAAASIVD